MLKYLLFGFAVLCLVWIIFKAVMARSTASVENFAVLAEGRGGAHDGTSPSQAMASCNG